MQTAGCGCQDSAFQWTPAENTSPETFTLPFMLPMRGAQPESAGMTRATGFPCLVTTMPSGSRWSSSERHCSLNLEALISRMASLPELLTGHKNWSYSFTQGCLVKLECGVSAQRRDGPGRGSLVVLLPRRAETGAEATQESIQAFCRRRRRLGSARTLLSPSKSVHLDSQRRSDRAQCVVIQHRVCPHRDRPRGVYFRN